MIGERLHRARKAAGLSLRDFANRVGVNHTWINKFEKDQAMPDSTTLLKLGEVLHVRSEYFFRPQKIKLSQIEYRKRGSLPKKRLQAIEHEILDQIERRLEIEGLFPQPPIDRFRLPNGLPSGITDYAQIEGVATQVRHGWALGLNPIPALIDLLEMKGIRVFCIDARKDDKFNGLFADAGGVSVVVVGQYWPGDRQRLTLAHELGHLILTERLSDDMDEETACFRFAGAFLFPDVSVKKYLGRKRSVLELRELQKLKHEFGLSMAAIIRRTLDLRIIKASYYKTWNIEFRQKGWHKCEPGQRVKPEESALFESLVFRALAEGYVEGSKAAELLRLSLDEFHRYRRMEEMRASDCQ